MMALPAFLLNPTPCYFLFLGGKVQNTASLTQLKMSLENL